MIDLSIIVLVYNSELYLERCLESILNQEIENIKLILINDGSIGSSKKICEEYINRDKRIKFIKRI